MSTKTMCRDCPDCVSIIGHGSWCTRYRIIVDPMVGTGCQRTDIAKDLTDTEAMRLELIALAEELDRWAALVNDDDPQCETCGHHTYDLWEYGGGYCRLFGHGQDEDGGCPSHMRPDEPEG